MRVVGFEQDVIVRPEEQALLHEYLTAGEPGSSRCPARTRYTAC